MTIVEATGSVAIGRDPIKLRAVAQATGVHIIMATGAYLEKFEGERITARPIEEIAEEIGRDLDIGIDGVRAGVIGEIGVSPSFTDAEVSSLRAAAIAQVEHPSVGLNIHMPGWQRRGHEVVDIVESHGVCLGKVALDHSDPSGADLDYQHSLLERGVLLAFDMIGLDISFLVRGRRRPSRRPQMRLSRWYEQASGLRCCSHTISFSNRCGRGLVVTEWRSCR